MPRLGLNEIARIVKGTVINGKKELVFSEYQFDSRKITKNSLFFAFKTDTNDGHKYIKSLNKMKSVAAVVSSDFSPDGIDIPLIVVDDPFKAVLILAESVRKIYSKIRYVAITGSAGKTTTKEFLYQMLSKEHRVYRSYLNWNNWQGLPFSLLQIKGDEEFAIFEMGMSDPGIGEIDFLTSILKPDVAMVLNVFPVHLEFLKTLGNIAKAKSEIFNYLTSDSIGFASGDFDVLIKEVKQKKGKIEFFGKTAGVNKILLGKIVREKDVTSFEFVFYGIKDVFKTKLISHAHIENLFSAIIIAKHLGIKNRDIQRAIWSLKPLTRRGLISEYGDITVIDESYNSNPEALKKALSWIDIEYSSDKTAVLGDMLELGEEQEKFHFEIGFFFSKLGFKRLITVGKLSRKIAEGAEKGGYPKENIFNLQNINEAEKIIKNIKDKSPVFLFKSSRDSGLNRLVESLYAKG